MKKGTLHFHKYHWHSLKILCGIPFYVMVQYGSDDSRIMSYCCTVISHTWYSIKIYQPVVQHRSSTPHFPPYTLQYEV